jgi:hypothetical protein
MEPRFLACSTISIFKYGIVIKSSLTTHLERIKNGTNWWPDQMFSRPWTL